MKYSYFYMMANANSSVTYTGETVDLCKRVWEHKNKTNPKSFTAKYNVDKLVYYEQYEDLEEAIAREKKIKAGSRKKKIELIKSKNPLLQDLYEEICG